MKKLTKLLIIIAVIIMTVTPMYVYGMTGNGSEGDGYIIKGGYTDEEKSKYHGWGDNACGYRLYIIDNETGCLAENMAETDGIKVIDLLFGDVPTSDITIKTGTRYTYYGDYDVAYNRVTASTVLQESLRSIPKPIVGPGLNPNGITFKGWMIATNSSTGKANGLDLISNLFGEETLKVFIENDLSLVVETIVWTDEPKMVTKPSGNKEWVASGKWLYGTVYDWARWFEFKDWDFNTRDSKGRVQYGSKIYGSVVCNSLTLADTVGSFDGWVIYGNSAI